MLYWILKIKRQKEFVEEGTIMVSLRNFCIEDSVILYHQNRYQMSLDAIQKMIAEWNTKLFNNRYYEMFAVIHNNQIVGTISLYQHSHSVVSIGPEIA